MRPNFALSLSLEGISLLFRAPDGWRRVGDVSLNVANLPATLAKLRADGQALTIEPITTKIVLPDDQVRYLRVDTSGLEGAARFEAVQTALSGATPYALDDLAYDVHDDDDVSYVAAVALETLQEAEAFANLHAFNPRGFVAMPEARDFPAEPSFGPTSTTQEFTSDESVIVVLGDITAEPEEEPEQHAAPEPVPEPEPEPTPEPVSFSSMRARGRGGEEVARDNAATEGVDNAAAMSEGTAPAVDPVFGSDARPEPEVVEDREPELDFSAVAAPGLAIPDFPEERGDSEAENAVPPDRPSTPVLVGGLDADLPADPEINSDLRPDEPDDVETDIPARFVPPPKLEADARIAPSARKKFGRRRTSAASMAATVGLSAQSGQIPAPDDETARMTVFGARQGQEPARGTRRFLGLALALVALFLLFFVGTGFWAWQFLGSGTPTATGQDPAPNAPAVAETGLEGLPQQTDFSTSATDTTLAPAPDPGPLTGRDADPMASAPDADTTAAASQQAGDTPQLQDISPEQAADAPGLSDTDAAVLEALAEEAVDAPDRAATLQEPDQLAALPEADTNSETATPSAEAVQDGAPEGTTPADAAADEGVAGDIAPEDGTPVDALPPETVNPEAVNPDTASQDTESPDTASQDTASQVAAPEDRTVEDASTQEATTADAALIPGTDQTAVSPALSDPRPVALNSDQTAAPATPATPGVITLDDLFLAAIDRTDHAKDAVALLPQQRFLTDRALDPIASPPAADTTFDLNAQGLVVPTPDGTLNPDGVLVIAGRPPVVPPAPPNRATPVAEPAPEEDAARRALAALRPQARPGGPGESATRTDPQQAEDQTDPQQAEDQTDPQQAEDQADPQQAEDQTDPQQAEDQTDPQQADEQVNTAVAALRPRARPQALSDAIARLQAVPESTGRDEASEDRLLDGTVSQPREEVVAGSALARAVVTRPSPRPRNFAPVVRRQAAPEVTPPEPQPRQAAAAAPAAVRPQTVQPRIPSSASVARQATLDNAINLRRVNLIGVYGTPSNRRALVRLPSGRYKKVKVGDRVDGGRILAIGDSELRYQKGGRNLTLKIPSG